MIVLQMEHPVPDFDNWKKVFDSDPLQRKKSGVRQYRIFRAINDPKQVIIELEFDNLQQAESMHEALKKLWNQVEGRIITGVQARLLESVEIVDYS